jgi:hypothetical protein
MTYDIQAAIAQAAAQGPNVNEVQKGGGGYKPPEEGPCLGTLVGYIEIGNHEKTIKGVASVKPYAQWIFELAGGKNAPRKNEETGELIPHRITITTPISRNEKAGYYKLFQRLSNGDASITHPAQLLERHWLLRIVHNKWTPAGATEEIVTASIGSATEGWNVSPPVRPADPMDPESKEQPLNKPARISELRLFLWDFPSKAMWDALYIDGEYPERKDDKGKVTAPAKSKNVIQAKIKSALNWADSPMAELLGAGELELPETTAPATTSAGGAADEDPLAGL